MQREVSTGLEESRLVVRTMMGEVVRWSGVGRGSDLLLTPSHYICSRFSNTIQTYSAYSFFFVTSCSMTRTTATTESLVSSSASRRRHAVNPLEGPCSFLFFSLFLDFLLPHFLSSFLHSNGISRCLSHPSHQTIETTRTLLIPLPTNYKLVETTAPICVEKYSDHPQLGRFSASPFLFLPSSPP